MNAPTDSDHETRGAGEPGQGPRVNRDEVRDLARLRRSRSDRKVAGVAGGIARHLDIDPLLVRVGFVVLAFFGGGGLILYAAAWVVVPEEDTEDTVVRIDEGVRTAVLVIAGALALAAMVGDSVGGFSFPWPVFMVGLVLLLVFGGKNAIKPSGATHPWLRHQAPPAPPAGTPAGGPTYPGYRPGPPPPARAVDPRKRGPLLFWFTVALALLGVGVVGTLELAGVEVTASAYPATVLGVVGVMLLVGAFYGRAGGLILIGLLAAAATALTSVADDLDFRGGVGEIRKSPDTAAQVRDTYELAVGDVRIDLSDVRDLENLDGETITIEAGVGNVRVIVPDDGLAVRADADSSVGEVKLFGDKGGAWTLDFTKAADARKHIDAGAKKCRELTREAQADRRAWCRRRASPRSRSRPPRPTCPMSAPRSRIPDRGPEPLHRRQSRRGDRPLAGSHAARA